LHKDFSIILDILLMFHDRRMVECEEKNVCSTACVVCTVNLSISWLSFWSVIHVVCHYGPTLYEGAYWHPCVYLFVCDTYDCHYFLLHTAFSCHKNLWYTNANKP